MGDLSRRVRWGSAVGLMVLGALWTAPAALAGPPTHPPRGPVVEGLSHACGVAADSQGDLYTSSAGESKIYVFEPGHSGAGEQVAEIADSNVPCGLAVDTVGSLYVSEQGTGKVVRYTPDAYPLTVTPVYGPAEPIDESGEAKGIAVDPVDDRLYVADGDHVSVYDSEGNLGIDEVQNITIFEAASGTFTLEFGGQKTSPLPYNATAAEVQAALTGLSTIGSGNVGVEQGFESAFQRNYRVTFTGALGTTDVEALGCDPTALSGGPDKNCFINETVKGWSGRIGEGVLAKATGVAAYSSPTGDRHLFVADARGLAADKLLLFSGPSVAGLSLRREIDGASTPDGSFEFGAAGAPLAIDTGNREAGGDGCASVAAQACTAGHLLLYDAGHKALDEFEANGEYLDQISEPESQFVDGEPSAIAVERSGGAGDGTIYLGVGASTGAKILAFGPLAQPGRRPLKKPSEEPGGVSQELENAQAVATDDRGDVYAAAGNEVHVYGPLGSELTSFEVEDPHPAPSDLAIDSEGNVYVLEGRESVHYYVPSHYPPQQGTTYARHEPAVAESADFPEVSELLEAIAIDPGPGVGRDRLFLASNIIVRVYKPAREGSGVENPAFGAGLVSGSVSIAVEGASARNSGQTTVYVAEGGASTIKRLNGAGEEVIGRFNGAGCPGGEMHLDPRLAIDQADGHVLEFQPRDEAAREYDGSGSCVAEFGHFTSLPERSRIAVDSACALHVNPTTGEEEPLDETTTPSCAAYDPANGNAYVAYDDTSPEHPPYDVTAFGPLSYGEAPEAKTGIPNEFSGGEAALNGTVNPAGVEVSECQFEYLEEEQYISNGKTFAGGTPAPCAESSTAIGGGEKPVPVHVRVGIDSEKHYCVRLVAGNKFGTDEGEAVCFGPPRVETEPAHPIAYTEATLRAKLDPAGLPTTYRFQYGLAAGEYDHATADLTLAADAGAGEDLVPLTGLAEGTEYHFRVVVENEAKKIEGPDQTFVTLARRAAESCPNVEYRAGLSAKLPDCRAYELVTPAETNGLSPYPPDSGGALVGFDQSLTPPRGPGAGQSLAYFTPGTLPGFDGNGLLDGYRASRGSGEHPAAGWQSSFFGPTFAQADPNVERFPLMQGISSDQSYSIWKVEPLDPFAGLTAGTHLFTPAGFEALGRGDLGNDPDAVGRYLSASGVHVIFSSSAHLEPSAPPAENEALYDRAAGSSSAQVLTQSPSGSPEEETEFAAALRSKEQAGYLGASEDGSAVAFKAGVALYVRLGNVKTERVSQRTAKVGDPLDCAAGPLREGKDQLPRRHLQWLRNGSPISGASGDDIQSPPNYRAKAADEGAALQCLTVATEAEPRSIAVSAPVFIDPLEASQAPEPPAQIAAPTPVGPGVGTVETCNPGSWQSADSLAYQWYLDGEEVPGASSQTYEVQGADVPGTLQCVVDGTNAAATVAAASGLSPTSPAPAEPAPTATAQAFPKATYAGISEGGRYVFYALGDGNSPARLFRFDAQTEEVSEIAEAGIFANVSADGSVAFFSSEERLTGPEENENAEAAEVGARNLYAWDGGSTRFVARLASADFKTAAFGEISGMNMAAWTRAVAPGLGSGRAYAPTRSTPSGGVLAFQSHARLTAYDNGGVGEIYRYDPVAPAGERLTCPSCDPSGAAPGAEALFQEVGTRSTTAHTAIPILTEDGTALFFNSPDRLLPEDANSAVDVYEWRARGSRWGNVAGASSCEHAGGCLALISSGQGERDSHLYSMSADGHDVFILTPEKLVGADIAGSVSIYDAREGGGIPEATEAAPCQGDACQGSGTEAPTLPAPSTTGNEAPQPLARCPKGKRRIKGRCVKKHHRAHSRHRHDRASHKGRGSR
jgi:hypothetical protein